MNGFVADLAMTRPEDRPAQARRLSAAAASGFTATLIHSEPGIHASGAWPEHRLLIQTSTAPHRARCVFDGAVAEHVDLAGDFCLQPATLPGLWENYGPVELLELRIAPDLLTRTAAGLDMAPSKADLPAQLWARDPHVEHISMALKCELERGAPVQRLYVESLGVALTARLLDRFGGGARRVTGGLSRRQLRRVFDHVEGNLDQDLPLADLARAAGLSVPHFTVLFRRSTGQSAHSYVIEQRVMRARRLILDGALSLAQVALEAGFAHQSHMARCMRRVLGLTPTEIAHCR
jgi:AraC family transcriptional regulator